MVSGSSHRPDAHGSAHWYGLWSNSRGCDHYRLSPRGWNRAAVFAGGAAGWQSYRLYWRVFDRICSAAFLVGVLALRGMGRTMLGTVIAMFLGNLVIYACGVVWLQAFIGLEKASSVV